MHYVKGTKKQSSSSLPRNFSPASIWVVITLRPGANVLPFSSPYLFNCCQSTFVFEQCHRLKAAETCPLSSNATYRDNRYDATLNAYIININILVDFSSITANVHYSMFVVRNGPWCCIEAPMSPVVLIF